MSDTLLPMVSRYAATDEDLTAAVLKYGTPQPIYYMAYALDGVGEILIYLSMDSSCEVEDIRIRVKADEQFKFEMFNYHKGNLYLAAKHDGSVQFLKIKGLEDWEFNDMMCFLT